jgi:hypothetical protein
VSGLLVGAEISALALPAGKAVATQLSAALLIAFIAALVLVDPSGAVGNAARNDMLVFGAPLQQF